MKYILTLLLIFFNLQAEDKKQNLIIGAGAFFQSQPYENVDATILPSPVIFFDNSIIYIQWSRAGVYFLGDRDEDFAWGFSLTAQPRVYGYKADDIAGMDERRKTFEGGLAFSTKKGPAHLELMLLTDILNRHDSWILKSEMGVDFKIGDFSFYPSLILVYESSKFLNYYYGVKKSEELKNRKAYTPNDGLSVGIQTYIKYPITKDISTLVNLRIDKLSNEATSSPIVNEDYLYSGLLSLIYTFKY
ncbi:MAG: MipA/OmpV family protein [Sulfurimonas sp.]|uniref:MipA/OmpV family protein n=1 Tax=Sulfurimonas sp. TaxID=2022749 RepID=UPI0025E4CC98|nr:MipA/OmpV family protein [Sulfurimonas sp.]MCK9491505.1 MipA/OmpV family protein [Sulfurimonas sp.]